MQHPETLSPTERELQTSLFRKINAGRTQQGTILNAKLAGQEALSPEELQKVALYNQTQGRDISLSEEGKILYAPATEPRTIISEAPLDREVLNTLQREAFVNHLFALYLEYVSSKSNMPKELSDIVTLQNKLHETKRDDGAFRLIDLEALEADDKGKALLTAITNIDKQSITRANIELFIKERIKDLPTGLQGKMIEIILSCKSDYRKSITALKSLSSEHSFFKQLATNNRDLFESGTTLVMMGSESERTGYSHEPVGIIMDIPSNIEQMERIHSFLEKSLTKTDIEPFRKALNQLISDSFSYDEKNQAGGRALRTPQGQARYIVN